MGSRNLTGGKKGVNLAKKGVKIEFPKCYYELIFWELHGTFQLLLV
jgi:hypothetical protein